MSPIMGLLPGHPAESLRPRLRRDRHDPAGRTSRIHRNPRTTEHGLYDRSSAPRRVANRTAPDRVAAIVSLRRLRMTAAEIAETLAMPLSTVSAVLNRSGIGRLGRIGLEPPVRYE